MESKIQSSWKKQIILVKDEDHINFKNKAISVHQIKFLGMKS